MCPLALRSRQGRGNVVKASEDLARIEQVFFAGGDCETGPALVINAIAAGRKAAQSIDRYLGGKGTSPNILFLPRRLWNGWKKCQWREIGRNLVSWPRDTC